MMYCFYCLLLESTENEFNRNKSLVNKRINPTQTQWRFQDLTLVGGGVNIVKGGG